MYNVSVEYAGSVYVILISAALYHIKCFVL